MNQTDTSIQIQTAQRSQDSFAVADPRISYTLSVLLDSDYPDDLRVSNWLTYGFPDEDNGQSRIIILPSEFFHPDTYGKPGSLPRLPLETLDGTPVLYGRPVLESDNGRLIVHADIIASSYVLLTRYEEWVRQETRDEHGRFPGRESLAARGGFINRPIVDEYGRMLRTWARSVGVDLPDPQRKFSVLLTHDVDHLATKYKPFQPARSMASAILGRQPIKDAFRTALGSLKLSRDPLNNLVDVVEMDRRMSEGIENGRCQSVFFFMSGGNSEFDGHYSLDDAQVRESIQSVIDSGAKIGLHASYDAGRNPQLISEERNTLESAAGVPIHRNRHHFLAWREPEDSGHVESAGITWDSTFGYADVAGFRLGVCRPVQLFDPVQQRLLNIEEHPLIVMDNTLSKPTYMNLSEEEAFEEIRKLAETTRDHNGEFVILWHNHVLADNNGGYHRRLYERVLNHLATLM